MEQKGFTLIEVVAIIVILGIILMIIMPNLVDVLNRSKERLNENQKNQILEAARLWGMEHLSSSITSPKNVTIGTLQNAGFLEDKDIRDLINKQEISTNTIVCITYQDNQYLYTYEGDKIKGGATCKK